MKKTLLFILLLILLLGCKKGNSPDTVTVTYANEYTNGNVKVNDEIYICGYQDNVCPNDFSANKPVCKVEDSDCI